MQAKKLSAIVEQEIIGDDRLIAGLALDSRKVQKNYLFFAVRGEVADGHQYIVQAIANGAAAVVLENDAFMQCGTAASYVHIPKLKSEIGTIAARFYDNPSQAMSVIGVTGTNGKTSVTNYIAQLLEVLGKSCGVIGTLGISYAGNTLTTGNTTPDAITLQKSFHDMAVAGATHVAMEVSSHALHQYRCAGTCFDTAIISNISHDHLDYHGDFSAYVQAKLALFTMPGLRLAIINEDDQSARKIRAVAPPSLRIISYSADNSSADVYLSAIQSTGNGYTAILRYHDRSCEFRVSLLGYFNLYNMLAAIIAVCEQGYEVTDVVRAAETVVPVAGRMQMVPNSHNIIAVVDYAHTPDALDNVLTSLKAQVAGRIVLVFGCGGDRDKTKRPKMAEVAERHADYIIVTADNPRTEPLSAILDDICSGFKDGSYERIPDREQAIMMAVTEARHGDCVLVAGKGHEKTQIIGNEVRPFDDVQVLMQALAAREISL